MTNYNPVPEWLRILGHVLGIVFLAVVVLLLVTTAGCNLPMDSDDREALTRQEVSLEIDRRLEGLGSALSEVRGKLAEVNERLSRGELTSEQALAEMRAIGVEAADGAKLAVEAVVDGAEEQLNRVLDEFKSIDIRERLEGGASAALPALLRGDWIAAIITGIGVLVAGNHTSKKHAARVHEVRDMRRRTQSEKVGPLNA